MRARLAAAFILFVILGCSGGTVTIEGKPGLATSLEEFEFNIGEAKGNVESAMRSAADPERDPEERPELEMLSAIQLVASTSVGLAELAAGKPVESEVQSIIAQSRELLKKTQTRPNYAEAIATLDKLKADAAAVRAKL